MSMSYAGQSRIAQKSTPNVGLASTDFLKLLAEFLLQPRNQLCVLQGSVAELDLT